jgi:hypothetical protein
LRGRGEAGENRGRKGMEMGKALPPAQGEG